MKRSLRIIGLVALTLTLLVVAAAGVAYWLVDLDALVKKQLDAQVPALEQQLGRKVAFGAVSTQFLPTLGGRVESIEIGADPKNPADDRPLVHLDAVRFEVGLWRALVSLGKSVEIQQVAVDGLRVSLVRYADGTLSYQDIQDRLAAAPEEAPAPGTESAPLSPKVQEILRGLRLEEVRLSGGEIRLKDLATGGAPAESWIRQIDLRTYDVKLGAPIKVAFEAAVLANAVNFRLNATVGPIPETLELEGVPPVEDVKLRVDDVELAALTPYFGAALPVRLEAAKVNARVDVPKLVLDGAMKIDAAVSVKPMRFAGGESFDLSLETDLDADANAYSATVRKLELGVGAVKLSMAGKLENLAKDPRFENFSLKTTTLDPAKLLAYYPAARKSLPAGTKLAGPIAIDLTATGDANRQTVRGFVEMAALDVVYPGALEKPSGTPLRLDVDGGFTSSAADLKKLSLTVDALALTLAGSVRNFSDPTLDLTLSAPPFRFDRLARLAPGMPAKLAAAGVEAKGDGAVKGHVKGTLANLDAKLDVALTGLDLAVPGTTVRGDIGLKAAFAGDTTKKFDAKVAFDADAATIVLPETLDKKANVPFHADVVVSRNGFVISVDKLDLKLAELSMTGSGTLDQGAKRTDVKLSMAKLDLEKFAKTVPAVPLEYAKGGFVDADIVLDGDPNALGSMRVVLPRLNVKLGESDLRGSATIANLSESRYEADLQSDFLDADALYLAEDEPATAAPTAPAAPAVDRPDRRELALRAKIVAKKLKAYDYVMNDFRGEVRIENGRLFVDETSFRMFGGAFSAKGTEIEYWKAKKPFKANLIVKSVDVGDALGAFSKYGDALDGLGNFEIALSGVGFGLADLEKGLTGTIGLSLEKGRFGKADLLEDMTKKVAKLAPVPGLATQIVNGAGAFRNLAGGLVVKDGKLAIPQPFKFELDGQAIELGGAIGIAGGLDLAAKYALPGPVLTQLTQGKCQVDGAIPVPVAIRGTVSDPAFNPDLVAVGKGLVDACVKGALGDQLSKAIGVDVGAATKEAEAKLQAEAAKLKAEAERMRAEAEAKAKAEVERVKAELEAKARAEAERIKAEVETKARAEAEKIRKEAEARAKAEVDRLKAEASAKAKAEVDRLKKEAEAKAKADAKKKAGQFLQGLAQ